MNEEALRETVKSHSLDAILFPKSRIRDAVKVIDSIKRILPPKEGFHVFGPMAQLIWGGSVTLVEFQVGIFIEIGGPVRVASIGQAKSELPDKKAPMVVLNMDLLGFIDFGKETVAIDLSLFDSHIQKVPISGQMALRASWARTPTSPCRWVAFTPGTRHLQDPRPSNGWPSRWATAIRASP